MNVIKLIRNKCTRHNCHSCKGAMQTSLGQSVRVNSHMEEAHMVEQWSQGATYSSPSSLIGSQLHDKQSSTADVEVKSTG